MYFIEEFAKLRICLFRCESLRVLSESSKTCYFHPVSTLLLSAMVSMSHIHCLQIARLYWFSTWFAQGMFFGGSNLSKFRSKNLKASLMSFTCTLFSDKERCFNQSERALYGNFIIKLPDQRPKFQVHWQASCCRLKRNSGTNVSLL